MQDISGVDFPSEKIDLVDAARSQGAPQEVMSAFGRLPDRLITSQCRLAMR